MSCPICRDTLSDAVRTNASCTSCTGVVHEECVKAAVDVDSRCPLCREDLASCGYLVNAELHYPETKRLRTDFDNVDRDALAARVAAMSEEIAAIRREALNMLLFKNECDRLIMRLRRLRLRMRRAARNWQTCRLGTITRAKDELNALRPALQSLRREYVDTGIFSVRLKESAVKYVKLLTQVLNGQLRVCNLTLKRRKIHDDLDSRAAAIMRKAIQRKQKQQKKAEEKEKQGKTKAKETRKPQRKTTNGKATRSKQAAPAKKAKKRTAMKASRSRPASASAAKRRRASPGPAAASRSRRRTS
eukprot:TRINITY_DN92738_c0_g1_i1.p1 TRINITY_DN92738_c0_g1~~TRINITY_DN92738_c0_g1_i1.p1  ORF type:complete len:303 (-),score=71.77 TRINITY_DN92738_c0_g1_i1:243-1151(-)